MSTIALMPGLSPGWGSSRIMVSYLTMLPVHQPAGRVTSAISSIIPVSSRSCSSTRADIPIRSRPTLDSCTPTLTCILEVSGIISRVCCSRTRAPSSMSGVSFHSAAEGKMTIPAAGAVMMQFVSCFLSRSKRSFSSFKDACSAANLAAAASNAL